MNRDLVISFDVTNWCNLHCAHCCARSHKNNPTNFISLDKLDRYLTESKNMSVIPNELMCLTGGEAMAPYMHGNDKYIPNALELIYVHEYIPTIKTNGTWGKNESLRPRILSDLGRLAYKYGKLVTLDMSVDEFHNNKTGVANIVYDIVNNPVFMYGIRCALVGFDTIGSSNALNTLRQELKARKLNIEEMDNGDWAVYMQKFSSGMYVYNDYSAKVYDLGRAKQTRVYTSTGSPIGDINCFEIDNRDYAILNYLLREPINNRPLGVVLDSLMSKVH